MSCSLRIIVGLICAATVGSAHAHGRDVDFQRDVRPILTRHCSRCHGDKQDEGGLRLSTKQHAFSAADSDEPVIKPSDADGSLLIKRIVGTELGDQMPADAQALSGREIDVLRNWINAGAKWPDGIDGRHWAYVKPVRPELPNVSVPDYGNDIDRFIRRGLKRAKLFPTKRANKSKLLRRVSLTLTGLPPTIEELDKFLADKSDDAYQNAVDRLLASPRYGERWAQHWLDLARYADSNGFQADQLRETWAYRDWVIDALNADMPFDQFTIEQLAGDMLPNATVDQRIATGFHRTVPTNVEAGVHPEENRHNQVFDRVNTTGTVFLGATIECAQCHDHKYDPISQEEYYRLFAFFNNTPLEVKLNSGVQWELDGPKMDLPLPPSKQKKHESLSNQLAAAKADLKTVLGASEPLAKRAQHQWEARARKALGKGVRWDALKPSKFTSTGGETHQILEDHSILVGGKVPPKQTIYTIEFDQAIKNATAIRLDALLHESLPGKGPGRGDKVRNNFVLHGFEVSVRRGDKLEPVKLVFARADFSQSNWNVKGLVDGNPKNGWAIAPQFSKPHWATLVFAEPLRVSGKALAAGGTTQQRSDGNGRVLPGASAQSQAETLVVRLVQNYGGGRTLGRVKLSTFDGEPSVAGIDNKLAAALRKTNKQRSKAERKLVHQHYTNSHSVAAKLTSQIADLEKQIKEIKPPTTLVMVEMEKDKARKTHILNRGNYLDPGKEVEPGTPSILHTFDDSEFEPNRLGFAKWLVSKDNPVVARVVVNRWWNEIFGRGLVETPEDFGTQSEPPTHPKLLDWLATEFMRNGWSMKHMHRLMVTSAAFQRSSNISSESLAVDPKNRWYGRGPRYRLPAETIRDNALAIAGLLETKMHGPPIMPYQPGNIWRAVGRNAPKWKTTKDSERFRRGVYVVWRRAAPYPSFVNFDAPDRADCVVNRPRTNTPTQALTLLNDPAHIEHAFGLAHRMLLGGNTIEEKIEHGFRRCIARKPTDEELDIVANLYRKELARFKADPTLADKLFKTVAEYRVPNGVDRVELAAWATIANALLNLDETITNG